MNLHAFAYQACEDYKVDLEERRDKVSEVEQLIEYLPKHLKKGIKATVDVSCMSIDIRMPFDPPRIKKFLQLMAEKGWEDRDFERDKTSYIFHHPETEGRVWLILSFDMEGATCVKKKIGTKLVETEQNIYEVVCKDGAAEETF